MQIWTVVVRAIEEFNQLRAEGGIFYWIVVGINALAAVYVLYTHISTARGGLWKSLNFIGKFLYVLFAAVRCMLLPVLSVFFFFAGEMEITTTDLFNNKYFVEIIAVAIVGVVLQATAIWLQGAVTGDDDIDEDTSEEMGKRWIKNLILLILSVLFIFTDLENGLVNFGFSIRGQKIGSWVFGAYAAWSGAAVIAMLSDGISTLTYLTMLPYVGRSKN